MDMTGKKCRSCKKGKYYETSHMDDWDGVVHCSKCGHEVKRHQEDKMVVYKLVGRTSPLDWATMAEDVELGLFRTMHAAQSEKEWREADPHFGMEWDHLFIKEIELIG